MKKTLLLISALVFAANSFAADQTSAPKIEEGKQYIMLDKFASPEKEVVEFFSFNCSSCFAFEESAKGAEYIQSHLPKDVKFKKYHLDNFGPLANELAQAWAIASVLKIQDKVAPAIYDSIHVKRALKSADDIVAIFKQAADVSPEKYKAMQNNLAVQAFMAQQKAALDELQPFRIPAFYINGKYFINNQGLTGDSTEAIIRDYSRVVNHVLSLP